MIPFPILGDISAEHFLADYWQKKPLLVRSAISDFKPPIEGDELAGLALESEVESRLIVGSCLLYTSPSPRDQRGSRMPSSA